ncbi:hypothetical protein BO85DRAFT_280004 [Aspergillus piperis CBS 112811]|uniref:Uncharacterized protein n=1 Tax=Aspergillus piperis CBS 112811 TaxID=1448313 RepID=A0A8G1VNE6_9EURO|nr:hypothetical protein BO85DRAFT_280004 [Aspergillus piperis CBS 112811]RAH58700.1 hypothetical protein BO85DRAFT_280004 [Aspergillus piperis CBS 112811]
MPRNLPPTQQQSHDQNHGRPQHTPIFPPVQYLDHQHEAPRPQSQQPDATTTFLKPTSLTSTRSQTPDMTYPTVKATRHLHLHTYIHTHTHTHTYML